MTLKQWRDSRNGQALRRAVHDLETVGKQEPASRAMASLTFGELIERALATVQRVADDLRRQGP